ncbi:hypothetical protein [Solimonas flava]|uniref:hypothetical protein n=1 Tax=Solimonas flava TaxID=415849 RepID=UPI00040C10DF|nr:hypothetical protein [Solimonas flava]
MKALNIFNAVMLALAATFAVTLGVVWILYAFNMDNEPRLHSEWRLVTHMTLSFLALTLVAAFAFWGQHRQRAWRWPAQGVQLLALAGGVWWMSRLLT